MPFIKVPLLKQKRGQRIYPEKRVVPRTSCLVQVLLGFPDQTSHVPPRDLTQKAVNDWKAFEKFYFDFSRNENQILDTMTGYLIRAMHETAFADDTMRKITHDVFIKQNVRYLVLMYAQNAIKSTMVLDDICELAERKLQNDKHLRIWVYAYRPQNQQTGSIKDRIRSDIQTAMNEFCGLKACRPQFILPNDAERGKYDEAYPCYCAHAQMRCKHEHCPFKQAYNTLLERWETLLDADAPVTKE